MTDDIKTVKKIYESYAIIKAELSKIIVGQDEIIEKLLISLYSKGHCLLIGVPGLAKTLIIKSLGDILGLKFSRIQFTPDLMPSDITGSEILEEDRSTGKKAFRFLKGPIFANIILADEINRTPPKTQSALLESMQEYRVTTSGNTFLLEEPFFVLATQNPIEQEGTYPLPEAQLDRFMFSLWLDYPAFNEEIEIVKRTTSGAEQSAKTVISHDDIMQFQKIVKEIPIADNTIEYAVKLVSSTRPGSEYCDEKLTEWIRWGAGPRASQCLVLGAKVRAVLHNRLTPEIDDIKNIASSVLRHRLVTSFSAQSEGVGVEEIISYIFKKIE